MHFPMRDYITLYLMQILLIVDYFPDECNEDTVEDCSEFRPEVPLSTKFNRKAFKDYCG